MCESFYLFGIEFNWFSILIVIGVLCLASLFFYRLRKLEVDDKTVDKVTIVGFAAGLCAFLGARFFDSLWHCIDDAMVNGEFVLENFKFDFAAGGITFAGAIVFSFPAFILLYPLFMKKDKYQPLFYLDQFIPGILIAHTFGRIGCWCGGCCYGGETDFFLGVYYPPAGAVVHPTQLYEATFLFISFIVFCFFVKKYATEKYLVSYAVWRFFVEFLRGDSRGASPFGFLTPSQFMSIVMIVGAVIIFFIRKKHYAKALIYYQEEEKEATIRYYMVSYKGIFKGIFKPCTCKECNKKMKLGIKSVITNENEIELLKKEHLVYHCKECNLDQEINPAE